MRTYGRILAKTLVYSCFALIPFWFVVNAKTPSGKDLLAIAPQHIAGTWRSEDGESELVFTENGDVRYSGDVSGIHLVDKSFKKTHAADRVANRLYAYEARVLKDREHGDTGKVQIKGYGSYTDFSDHNDIVYFDITFHKLTGADQTEDLVDPSDLAQVETSVSYTETLASKFMILNEVDWFMRYRKLPDDKEN